MMRPCFQIFCLNWGPKNLPKQCEVRTERVLKKLKNSQEDPKLECWRKRLQEFGSFMSFVVLTDVYQLSVAIE